MGRPPPSVVAPASARRSSRSTGSARGLRQLARFGTVEEGNVHLSGVYERSLDVSTDTPLLTDDALLGELRDECARWVTRDELEGGFARLFVLRDEARARGLPVPASCPQHNPEI
jgi:hypothetical protein